MEITTTHLGLTAELRIQGRIDTFWAQHLQDAVDYTIRQGARNIRLHLAGVDYLSSAGIRSLLASYKQLQSISGRMEIVQPSKSARAILEMAGLNEMIHGISEDSSASAEPVREVPTASAFFEVHDLGKAGTMQCALIGNPASLRSGSFRGNDARDVMFPDATFGVGLGAFGRGYEECRGRHGEFIAVAGAAAYQPTDGTDLPEYMVSDGDWVPELNVLYALWGQGRFSRQLLFDARADAGSVPWSEILETVLSTCGATCVGMAMVAESSGLMGVGLKRSLAGLRDLQAPLGIQEIRKSLSGEPVCLDRRITTVVTGVATLSPPAELGDLFQPVAPGSAIYGHFSAAVFGRHAVEEGLIDLRPTVQALFQSETITEMLHLLPMDIADPIAGQSHFHRGACWVGEISEISIGEV